MKKVTFIYWWPLLCCLCNYAFAAPGPMITKEPSEFPSDDNFRAPLGLPPVPWPKDNPYSQKKAELGRLLYFDKRLSSNGTVSCATCHAIPFAYADDKSVSKGINGSLGSRNSPTVLNSAYQSHLFWDGRAASLEQQCLGPIGNPKEMTTFHNSNDAHQQCQKNVRTIAGYRQLFNEVFGNDECSMTDIAKAIATFERTLLSGNAPFDHYLAGEHTAMTAEQIHGYEVFNKSGCANCHFGFNFSDGRFLNIGVGMDASDPDLGRYEISNNDRDRGAFKVPTLRETSKTPPYMHDGSLSTLEAVIDYYDKGGIPNKHLSPLMRPLHLSTADKQALVSFLHALEGEGWQHFQEPKTFPE